jgi:hypothetical protein
LVLFWFVSRNQKLYFRFVSVFRTRFETTETNRSVSKQTEKNKKNTKETEKFRYQTVLKKLPKKYSTVCHIKNLVNTTENLF